MDSKYQPNQFEKKWTEIWDKENTYKSGTSAGKQYVLAMFPYPSGAGLHVGHVRNYTGTDVVARYFRMNGKAVLHPMGWDAFGLPAENAAIKAKKNPMDMVPEHIATFKRQMKSLGFSYDWDREFTTTDPTYYKWTQWLFIQFYKMGLLYKKNTPINFCPKCKTGLAEEEVLADGTHERCGSKITKKDLPQWIFKITKYADRLLSDLEGLDWPEGILAMQRNWIGKKEGINIDYKVVDPQAGRRVFSSASPDGSPKPLTQKQTSSLPVVDTITCFTTRPDTNFGATFIVIAPEHQFVKKILNGKLTGTSVNTEKIREYVDKSASKSEIERQEEGKKKTGVFTGFYAINNLNGREMPVWISDFVLSNFGTGAVVGVPGHDLRDFEFAREFGIDILRVVVGSDNDTSEITRPEQVQEKEGKMINSDFLNGLDIHEATKKVMDHMEKMGWGKKITTYHLRDWIFSRQRYWGEPIPMVYCEKCDWQSVPEKELPLKLPYLNSYEPGPMGESPLSSVEDWVNTKCPKCQGQAKRETDTMPNWAGSCWYFLRFADSKNDKEPWGKDAMKKWMPVDWYLGGAEHAVLHLLYSRFWVKALYDLKLLDFKEPFLKLRNQGMILAEDHRKMSKSYGNVINPDIVVNEYGADALRIYEMFMAPFNTEIPWSTKALQGSYRFVKRVWELYSKFSDVSEVVQSEDVKLVAKLYKTIRKITTDIPDVKFNTSIAAMMEFLNDWEKNPQGLSKENAKKFLQVLAPFAPFMTEEIWHSVFNEKQSIHLSSWPAVGNELIEDEVAIPVQVMGKLRAIIQVKSMALENQKEVETFALQNEKIKKYLEGKQFKTIYVKGKVLNIVIISPKESHSVSRKNDILEPIVSPMSTTLVDGGVVVGGSIDYKNRSKYFSAAKKQLEANVFKHSLALEACMGGLYDYFKSENLLNAEEPSKEDWMLAGFLHDIDYSGEFKPTHPQKTQEALAKYGLTISETVHNIIKAHAPDLTGYQPKNKAEWSIYCADSLTGLIMAVAFVYPSRKLADVKLSSVVKRLLKEPKFAAGTRREDIKKCIDPNGLNLPIEKFVDICLLAMKSTSSELGL